MTMYHTGNSFLNLGNDCMYHTGNSLVNLVMTVCIIQGIRW
jgi:hypothetical protein